MSEYAALDRHKEDPVVAFTAANAVVHAVADTVNDTVNDSVNDTVAETPRWTMRAVVLATLIAVGIGLAFLLLYRFYMIVFLFFVAFSLATAMKPIVGWLQKRNIPLVLGILPLYLGILGLIAGFIWFMGPLLVTQFVTFVRELPAYYSTLRLYLQNSPNELLQTVGSSLPLQLSLPLTQLSSATTITDVATDPIGLVGKAVSNTGKTLFMLIGVLLLAYYWLVEGDVIIRRLVLRTRLEQREQIRELITEIEGKIGGYFRGQLLLCLIIGILSLVAFLLIGVPNALMLGLISGVTEAIPILGPTLGAVPAILMTLSTDPEKSLWVIVAMVIIQSLENNFLVPRVMDKSVGVNPLITILSIAAFGLLFGFVGAILAIPLAAILQILVSRLLFSSPTTEEVSPIPEASQSQARSRFAVLRREAQELAQDVRKQARNHAPLLQVYDAQIEQAEDMIETVASKLESYLVQQECAR
jgi:predicted PurR-regulated permease PerM